MPFWLILAHACSYPHADKFKHTAARYAPSRDNSLDALLMRTNMSFSGTPLPHAHQVYTCIHAHARAHAGAEALYHALQEDGLCCGARLHHGHLPGGQGHRVRRPSVSARYGTRSPRPANRWLSCNVGVMWMVVLNCGQKTGGCLAMLVSRGWCLSQTGGYLAMLMLCGWWCSVVARKQVAVLQCWC